MRDRPQHGADGGGGAAPEPGIVSRLFAAGEVDRDPRLKLICACLLVYFHLTFQGWWEDPGSLCSEGAARFDAIPAPALADWPWIHFLDLFQVRLHLYGLGVCTWIALLSLALSRSSAMALALMTWLWVNKAWFYACDVRSFANFHHFHLLFTLSFLVARDKLRWFRATLALGYLLSAVVKLTPSWLEGEYFLALPDHLPLLPKSELFVRGACLAVIALELLGPLCWFTGRRWLRRASFAGFVLFHLYSGVIVGYWYTALMVPLVALSFRGFDAPLQAGYRFTPRDLVTYALFAAALGGAACPLLIPGDARLTGEGRSCGLFMFDANHSTHFTATIRKGSQIWVIEVERNWQERPGELAPDLRIRCTYRDGERPPVVADVAQPLAVGDTLLINPAYFEKARMRVSGDAYLYWYWARELERRFAPDRLSIRVDRRLDRDPAVVTVVDVRDFAALAPEYRSFRHNDWIRLPDR